ncbi:hypothetical protein, partial [Rhizobium sp. FY34]
LLQFADGLDIVVLLTALFAVPPIILMIEEALKT